MRCFYLRIFVNSIENHPFLQNLSSNLESSFGLFICEFVIQSNSVITKSSGPAIFVRECVITELFYVLN
jgi:hypothetical protein